MAIRHIAAACLGACLAAPVGAQTAPVDPHLGCAGNPAVVAKCFAVQGRIGVYNGTPSIRIRPDNSKRLLGVVPSEQEIMPDDLRAAIGIGTDAHAKMQVCPVSKPSPRKMQSVCIESAQDIRTVKRH